ncbi:MAG: MarR family transcriptional regulator, partial [Propioniciclava sp.]
RALLTSGSLAAQVSVALGRPVDYEGALSLAREGHPAARTVIEMAAEALGTLIALSTNLTLQSDVILAGEGVALYAQERSRVEAVIASQRNAGALPVRVEVDDSGFPAWARGAAAVAIQSALPRLPRR